jgi:hypothetical protein
LGETF